VVLYEMLTGARLFEGETIAHTLADVLRAEIDLTKLPAETPARLRALLARCLDRNPRTRLRDIGEARIALQASPGGETPAATPVATARASSLPWVLAGVFAVLALGAGWAAWKGTRSVEAPLSRFRVDLGPGSVRAISSTAVLSPDGRRITYTVRGAQGTPMLATRLLEENAGTMLAGTENGEQPFFSPDGKWIGFFAGLELKKITVYGGAPVKLCTTTAPPRGADWGPDGYIVANLDNQHLWRVPESGGNATMLGDPEGTRGRSWRWPQIFGTGRYVMFTAGTGSVGTGYDDADIDVMTLKTGTVKTVARGGYFARYIPTGHLVYIHHSSLFAAPFDIDRMEERGAAVPILNDVAGSPGMGAGHLSFSDSGALVYLDGKADETAFQSSWADLAGKDEVIWSTPTAMLSPKVSPDGKLVAGSVEDGIVVYDPQRAAVRKLPSSQGRSVIWAPDGKHLAYSGGSGSAGELGIWWVRADGSSQPQLLFSEKTLGLRVTSFTPDGRTLAFWMTRPNANGNGGRPEIWTMKMDLQDPEQPRAGKPELFLTAPGGVSDAAFSPDGRWIAYTVNESGSHTPEVFVRPFPGGSRSGQWQISNAGGGFPVWSRKGGELYYKSILGGIMAVDYRVTGDALEAAKPHQTLIHVANMSSAMSFDLAPDGKRFLITRAEAPQDAGPVHVTFLLNFFDELKRRVR
jgi:Tol biopolymer transport system component